MHETDLVTMRVQLDGWFDTGATSANLSVARYHYVPDAPTSKRLSERHELFGYLGEVFLNGQTEADLTRHLTKAFSTYTTAMLLP